MNNRDRKSKYLALAGVSLIALGLSGCWDPYLADSTEPTRREEYSYHDYRVMYPRQEQVRVIQPQRGQRQPVQVQQVQQVQQVNVHQAPQAQHVPHQQQAQQAQQAQAARAREAQIAGDRAMAERLQAEEYRRAEADLQRRQAQQQADAARQQQIADDHALAVRLQAEENARAVGHAAAPGGPAP